ncbi:MAG: ABC transporter permease [Patescibacteria group bacterium]
MRGQNGYKHLLKAALADFKRNKMRTFLTSLGIMIGVLSVVMLIALGLGLRNYIQQQFESLGANLLIIMPGNSLSGEGGLSSIGPGLIGGIQFDEKDVKNLQGIAGVDYVVPVFFKSSLIEAGSEEKIGYVEGSNEEMFEILNVKMTEGEVFTKSDVTRKAKVAVLGYNLAEDLFGDPADGVGQTVRVENQRLKVIGVAEKKGDNELDNSVILPYRTTFGTLNPNKTFFTIYLGVNSDDDIEFAKEEAKKILLKRYEESEFSVTEQAEILSTVNQIFGIINAVLVAIGSISLIVGGIGIMNIMYATVTERTKEVGIRRAVGATKKDILKQFLTESVVLSVFGGLLGLIAASLLVLIIRIFFPAAINLFSVIITLVISSGIGIFFGVLPARRAAELSPIQAIRYE